MKSWISKFAVVAIGITFCIMFTPRSGAHHEELAFMGGSDVEIATVIKRRLAIDTSAAEGAFRAIRLYNFGDRIDVTKVIVNYADGSEHVENRSFFLSSGERTREIDPRASRKFVDSVVVQYKRRPFSKNIAQLQVRGRQTREDRRTRRSGSRNTTVAATPKPEPTPEPEAVPEPAQPEYQPPENKVVIGTSSIPQSGGCGGPRSLLIATGNVSFGEDTDSISVERPEMGKFDKVRLCVKKNDIELLDLKISFKDGENVDVPFAGIIRSGERTDEIDLEGKHFVDSINIKYKKRRNFSGRADVEFWGVLSSNWLDGEAENFNEGWVQLTSGDTAGFIGFEVDRSEVPPHQRGFSDLRVVTRNRDITLDYVKVTFGDGSEQKFDANRTKVEPETGYGPLKIENGPKVVTNVEARYRSRFFDRGAQGQKRATVEIHGHR
ncbi:MAG: hypothetical protein ACRBCJ_10000 [Hyphomicrobiaceae bacterium]